MAAGGASLVISHVTVHAFEGKKKEHKQKRKKKKQENTVPAGLESATHQMST